MKLRSHQQRQWDHLALNDPFWGILADPAKRHGRWDPDEFFATGQAEIAAVMHDIEDLGYPRARKRALDFGCGTGRATQALADWFDHVTGVDISPSMLDLARKYNRAGARCVYTLNVDGDLHGFDANHFDFIYSRLVLQHLRPRQSRQYVREFLRVLRPSGLLLFQLPSRRRYRSVLHRLGSRWFFEAARRVLHLRGVVEMHGIFRDTIVRDLQDSGGRLLDVRSDESAGPKWESYLYAVTK